MVIFQLELIQLIQHFLNTVNFKSCKIHLELNWSKNCVMSNIVGATSFKITNTKLHVPIVTLSSKDNAKLVKLLEDGFNRPVYWNEYQTKIKTRNLDNNNLTRFPLDASFQGVRRLFALVFDNTENGAKKSKEIAIENIFSQE